MDASNERQLNRHLDASHGSFELVLSPLLLAGLGWLVDARVLHTTPVFTVIAAVFGLAGACVKLYLEYTQKMATLRNDLPSMQAAERAV